MTSVLRILVLVSLVLTGQCVLVDICDEISADNSTCIVSAVHILDCTQNTTLVTDAETECDIQFDGSILLVTDSRVQCSSFNCTLSISATGNVELQPNVEVFASTILVDALAVILASGSTINADGRGWQAGPGSPVAAGNGAGHVGAGGKLPCTSPFAQQTQCCDGITPFVNPTLPYDDMTASNWDYAWGSGAGAFGGRGGGRIRIRSDRVIVDGYISADGAAGNATGSIPYGAGAGGTVYIQTGPISGIGSVRAAGGAASSVGSWAGGGGGRVIVDTTDFALSVSSLQAYGGGQDQPTVPVSSCLTGSAGTILLLERANATLDTQLRLYNRNLPTLASSAIDIHGSDNINSCMVSAGTSIVSSTIVLSQPSELFVTSSSQIIYPGVISPGFAMNSSMLISADEIDLASGYLVTGNYYGLLTAANITLGPSFGFLFYATLEFRADWDVMIMSQTLENAAAGNWPLLYPILKISAGRDIFVDETAVVATGFVQMSAQHKVVINGRVSAVPASTILTSLCNANASFFQECMSSPSGTPSNFSLAIYAKDDIVFGVGSEVLASFAFLCARYINMQSTASASGFGCPGGTGVGRGAAGRLSGGGGGHVAAGGSSADSGAGGLPYDFGEDVLYPGSGGGSGSETAGFGGGYIVVGAERQLHIDVSGLLAANGEPPSRGSAGGGGSGGGIFIRTAKLSGTGAIKAEGGDGGTVYGGGGGSGGKVVLKASLLAPVDNSDNDGSINIQAEIAQEFYGTISVVGGQGVGGSTNGGDGKLNAPPCPGGFGGSPRCVPCGLGFYRVPGDDNPDCLPCSNAPEGGEYSDPVSATSICPYICPAGTLYPTCQTAFEQMVELFGGPIGFWMTLLVIVIVLFLVLLGLCRIRKWRSALTSQSAAGERTHLLSRTSHSTAVPSYEFAKTMLASTNAHSTIRGQVLEDVLVGASLSEQDIPNHVGRVYIAGFNTFGRPWQLPEAVPLDLQPFVTDAYREFVERMNRDLGWSLCGFESVVYVLLSWIFYPCAARFARREREKRALKLLIGTVAADATWLMSGGLRGYHFAPRVGISADLSLAYIDLVADKVVSSPVSPNVNAPLPKFTHTLPLTIPFAGEGTFINPFYLDPDDFVVRSVPSTPGLTRFIDESWLEFVAELNVRARVVSTGAESQTMHALQAFVRAVNMESDLLGGLVVRLAWMWPGLNTKLSADSAPATPNITRGRLPHTLTFPEYVAPLSDMRLGIVLAIPSRTTAIKLPGSKTSPVLSRPTKPISIPQQQKAAAPPRQRDYRDDYFPASISRSYPEIDAGTFQLAVDDDGVNVVQAASVDIGIDSFLLPSSSMAASSYLPHSSSMAASSSTLMASDTMKQSSHADKRAAALRQPSSVPHRPAVHAQGPEIVSRYHKHYRSGASGGSWLFDCCCCCCGRWVSKLAQSIMNELLHGFIDNGGTSHIIGSSVDASLNVASLVIQPAADGIDDTSADGNTEASFALPHSISRQRAASIAYDDQNTSEFVYKINARLQTMPVSVPAASQRRTGFAATCLFYFERLLRRRTLPMQTSRNKRLVCAVTGNILLFIIELLLTLVLSTQLFCIEPESESGGAANMDLSQMLQQHSNNGTTTSTAAAAAAVMSPLRLLSQLQDENCDYAPFIVYVSTPPGATLLPPLCGLAGLAMQSASTLSTFAVWNGRSLWTALFALLMTTLYSQVLSKPTVLVPLALLTTKVLSAQLVPWLLATFESERPVRGWRGLYEVRRGPREKSYRRRTNENDRQQLD